MLGTWCKDCYRGVDDTYGSDQSGAVGSYESGFVLGFEDISDADHVWGKVIDVSGRFPYVLCDRILPCCGIPSVILDKELINWFIPGTRQHGGSYQTTRGISALIASSIPAAATGGLDRDRLEQVSE